jgi:ankyrin repeat protein
MVDRYNRDEMFYRIAHINIDKAESKEDVLKDMNAIVNPNFQDSQGTSYLHMACQSHCIEAVTILLEKGANPNIEDNRGMSPIMKAVSSRNDNNCAILEVMLKHGLDLDKLERNMTLKEKIESFKDEKLNGVIQKYTTQ